MQAQDIEMFLSMVRDAQEEYHSAYEQVERCERKMQDIEHYLEFNILSHHQKAKVAGEMQRVRQIRRDAKNRWERLRLVNQFAEEHKPYIGKLQKLLGEMRKIERNQENRYYLPKTTDVDDAILGGMIIYDDNRQAADAKQVQQATDCAQTG